jgi:hypothetical protein
MTTNGPPNSSQRLSSVVVPERLWEFVTNLRAREANVLEHMVAEFAQLLP